MCAVSLANYIWNDAYHPIIEEASMRVEYQDRHGKYRNLYYRLGNIYQTSDRREFRFQIVRDGGGVNCAIEARRSSNQEGSQVVMTHLPSHVSGLREEYYLSKKQVSSGRHVGSSRYGAFAGDINYTDRLTLYCELFRDDHSSFLSRYDLTVLSIKKKLSGQ
jgi:hypothetical protein